MTDFKPMLAGKAKPEKLKFPLLVQPKLDGIRASVVDGKLLTRTLKEVPNRFIFNLLSRPEFEGLDGELIVGTPTALDCYRQTASGVMRESREPDYTYWVFDVWNSDKIYLDRFSELMERYGWFQPEARIQLVQPIMALDADDLAQHESKLVALGYEGAILRASDGLYKFGRGSVTKGDLLKLKRFEDSEAEILSVEEELHNANEATTNALGRTERSSHKANKIGKGTLGKMNVRDLHTGVEFSIGSGFDAAERADLWAARDQLPGKVAKYKHFPIGVKDKPRHSVFLGFREKGDMPDAAQV